MPRVPFVAKSLMLRARLAVAHTFDGAQDRGRACLRGRPRRVRSRPGIGASVRLRDRVLPGLASRLLESTRGPGGSGSEAGHGVRSPRRSSACASADLSMFLFGHPNGSDSVCHLVLLTLWPYPLRVVGCPPERGSLGVTGGTLKRRRLQPAVSAPKPGRARAAIGGCTGSCRVAPRRSRRQSGSRGAPTGPGG